MSENPNDAVTRADLNQQLEIHAKTIELQIELSKQQEEILEKLEDCNISHIEHKKILDTLDKRTWQQGWMFWGMIFSLLSSLGVAWSKI